ncbi:MAG: YigZ family protein, partial [Anaerolineae bacterium]|nr:YigZ family protein [Anaerolineae bacterium]
VLQGSGLGDVVVVVTRYFGGIKLGTGGLVRAYSDSVREVLRVLPRAQKIATSVVALEFPYPLFERVRLLVAENRGNIMDEQFTESVMITARFRMEDVETFSDAITDLSRGTVDVIIIEEDHHSIMPLAENGMG